MARLPVQGSDAGVWGTILNDYLSVEHNADGTAKIRSDGTLNPGNLGALATSNNLSDLNNASTARTNLGLGSAATRNVGTVSGTVAAGDDSRLNRTGETTCPAQALGLDMMTAPIEQITGGTITNGSLFIERVWIPAGQAIGRIVAYVNSASTISGGGNNGFAVYDDTGTLVASTPADNNLWTATMWRNKTFTTPIAAQNSGRCVYIGLLYDGYSGTSDIMYNVSDGNRYLWGAYNSGVTFRQTIYDSGVTSFPASFDPTTYGQLTAYRPFLGILAS